MIKPTITFNENGAANQQGRSLIIALIMILASMLFMSVLLWANVSIGGEEKKTLIINSNASVKKYFMMQNEFKSKFKTPVVDIDLGSKWQDEKWLKNTIRDEKADLIVCIGTKAYVKADKFAKNIPKIFTLGINWQRLELEKNTYVLASEVPALTQLMMYRFFFPEIKKIGVLYSKSNNKEWFKNTIAESDGMAIEIIGKVINKSSGITKALMELLPKVDAFWLIPDPVLISGKKEADQIFKLCHESGKPVFAYEKIFAGFGAAFIVSSDIPTMARQAALIAENNFNGKEVNGKVQYPAGSYISINLEKLEEYGVKLNLKALPSVNEFIEEK